jgi:CRISPR-associated protein Cmr4
MKDFRVGYLYSLAPIHCGGEGDLGNILEIAREAHTNFPYIPGSSLRGSLRDEVLEYQDQATADRLFGKELDSNGQMGVHQIWFGDARLLWVPMRTMSQNGNDIFTWVSCPTLLRDWALISRKDLPVFPDRAVGDRTADYVVADAKVRVQEFTPEQTTAIDLTGNWSDNLGNETKSTWSKNRIVLPDSDFQVLMEHSLWTQVRNKIQASGGAEVFWTDVCIPRDTIFYYAWGYSIDKKNPIQSSDHDTIKEVLIGLIQVGGQANVGRGWVQSWIANDSAPTIPTKTPETTTV